MGGAQAAWLTYTRAEIARQAESPESAADWAARGDVAYALGRDDVAETAFVDAANLVESFVQTLQPERAARLLAAPAVEEILSTAGRAPAA